MKESRSAAASSVSPTGMLKSSGCSRTRRCSGDPIDSGTCPWNSRAPTRSCAGSRDSPLANAISAAARAVAADPDAQMREALRRAGNQGARNRSRCRRGRAAATAGAAGPTRRSQRLLEIRAAAGGDEAAIFAGDLHRMYSRYSERRGWTVEIVSESRGEHGGYREIISRIAVAAACTRVSSSNPGTHRVQRVPATESQGRIHTSTCTVAVLPEIAEVESERRDQSGGTPH